MKDEFPQYYDELAEALYKKGDVNGAILNYDRALNVDSTWINSHWLLGQIFEASGERSMALKHYQAYLKQDSTSAVSVAIRQRLMRFTY